MNNTESQVRALADSNGPVSVAAAARPPFEPTPRTYTPPPNIMQRSDELAGLLRAAGTTAAALARQIGMSASNLSKYLALQVLSEADKSLVRAGQLGLARAYQLAIARSS